MRIKNLSFAAVITTGLIVNTAFTSERDSSNDHRRFLDTMESRLERRRLGLPSDPTKTPTSPDAIEHKPNIKGPDRSFHRKRIYFGVDKEGNPCYRSIKDHESNPEFNNVKLVIFQEPTWRNAWNTFTFQDSFEEVGTYGDTNARYKLIGAIATNGGVWCPELKTIIGGSREIGEENADGTQQKCICDVYVESLQQEPVPLKFKK